MEQIRVLEHPAEDFLDLKLELHVWASGTLEMNVIVAKDEEFLMNNVELVEDRLILG